MKKILGLTVAALIVMALVGGGTWAYFSDVETSTLNTFAAGTLDLGLDIASGQNPTGSINGTFSSSDWAPGSTVNGTIWVNNEGSIPMSSVNLTITYSYNELTPDTVSSWNGTADEDYLDKMLVATAVTWNSANVTELVGQTLYYIENTAGTVTLGDLPADNEYPLYILWTFDSTATNGCQADSVDVTLTFNGYQ